MKKLVYICLTIVLCVIMSVVVYELVGLIYFSLAFRPNYIVFSIVALGMGLGAIIGGFFLGKCRWNIVYVEKRHRKYRRKFLRK